MATDMTGGKYEQYVSDGLEPLTQKLVDDCYNSIETLCNNAMSQAEKVSRLETDNEASEYAQQCHEVIAEIILYIKNRKSVFVPYIHELTEKVASSHDCGNCSGSCKLNHDAHVTGLMISNELMKKALNKLRLTTLPLYSQTMFPDEYRILRNRMALLEMHMTELFFLEHNFLAPKIVEAQRSINAGGK